MLGDISTCIKPSPVSINLYIHGLAQLTADMCLHLRAYMSTDIRTDIYICTNICTGMCTCIHIYACMHACIHTYIHTYLCMYTYTCTYLHRYRKFEHAHVLRRQWASRACQRLDAIAHFIRVLLSVAGCMLCVQAPSSSRPRSRTRNVLVLHLRPQRSSKPLSSSPKP